MDLNRSRIAGVTLTVALFIILSSSTFSSAWSNGGPSSNLSSPRYSTHDWIAQHALDWLPSSEKWFVTENLNMYLYGTELPDFRDAIGGDGIGDSQNHHVYYRSGGALQSDVGAQRAQDMFDSALNDIRGGRYDAAAKSAGAMAHYIGDLAVFGHVMGASTDWGEETHHSDYEDYMNDQTVAYSSSWDSVLAYDGGLENISARDSVLRLAYDTTFDDSGRGHSASWMNQHCNWSNADFKTRVGESLSKSVNAVADALHSLWVESGRPSGGLLSFENLTMILAIVIVVVAIMILLSLSSSSRSKKGRKRHHRKRI